MAVLLIPGLVFFGAIVLVALAQTANVHTKATTEAQQGTWAAILDQLTGRAYVRSIVKASRSAVSRWALAQLKPVTRWFVALTALVLHVERTHTATAEGTADAFERITSRTIPTAVHSGVAPVKTQAAHAGKTATKALGKANSTSTAFHGYRTVTKPKIDHATRAVDVTLPQSIGRVRTAEEKLSRDQAALRERTTSLEHGAVRTWEWIRTHPFSAVTGAFAGAVAIALTRLGYGFLRCRSWKSLGRRLTCGTAGLLEDLFFTAVVAFAASDLCDFADAVETAANRFQGVLFELVDVENALVGCHGATAPPALGLPALRVPPNSLGLPLAA